MKLQILLISLGNFYILPRLQLGIPACPSMGKLKMNSFKHASFQAATPTPGTFTFSKHPLTSPIISLLLKRKLSLIQFLIYVILWILSDLVSINSVGKAT